MTRETKIGMSVATGFLLLVGGVLGYKLYSGGPLLPDTVAQTGPGDSGNVQDAGVQPTGEAPHDGGDKPTAGKEEPPDAPPPTEAPPSAPPIPDRSPPPMEPPATERPHPEPPPPSARERASEPQIPGDGLGRPSMPPGVPPPPPRPELNGAASEASPPLTVPGDDRMPAPEIPVPTGRPPALPTATRPMLPDAPPPSELPETAPPAPPGRTAPPPEAPPVRPAATVPPVSPGDEGSRTPPGPPPTVPNLPADEQGGGDRPAMPRKEAPVEEPPAPDRVHQPPREVPPPPPPTTYDRTFTQPKLGKPVPDSQPGPSKHASEAPGGIPLTVRPQPGGTEARPTSGVRGGTPVVLSDQSQSQVDSFDVEVYEVKPGDTYASISRYRYRSDRYQHALARFNKERSAQLENLRVGASVFLPPVAYLEKKYRAMIPGLPAEEVSAPPKDASGKAPPAAATGGRTGTVQSDWRPARTRTGGQQP